MMKAKGKRQKAKGKNTELSGRMSVYIRSRVKNEAIALRVLTFNFCLLPFAFCLVYPGIFTAVR